MTILVSASNNIDAKLVKEAGFDGIWISGFEACCHLGIPDNGTITLNQMLSIAEPVVRATSLPVYVDVDTGYDSFAVTVQEMKNIGVRGVCIEDIKLGHKQNSLWGDRVPLEEPTIMARKIKRAKGIEIIARTEAYIRGYGEQECWSRLKRYREAGATWLLPHSRTLPLTVPDQDDCYATVPTKFPQFHNIVLNSIGYNMVIWANQTCRTQIKATRKMLQWLKEDGCMRRVDEGLCATLEDMRGLMPCE